MAQTADPKRPSVAIIGAGLAGLACARRLADAGVPCVVFEKSRGLGGRLATRRVDGIGAFDHGAPHVDARRAPFADYLRAVAKEGAAAPWPPEDPCASGSHFVGTPGMNALVKPLAAGLDVRIQTEIAALEASGRGWRLHAAAADLGEFDSIVLTAPPPQTRALIADAAPDLSASLSEARMAPAWTAMFAFQAPLEVDGDRIAPGEGPITLALRNSAKPGRPADHDCWVVHASEAWSRAHLEAERDDIAERLLSLAADVLGPFPGEPIYSAAHRWRYARTISAADAGSMSDKTGTLFIAGDWLTGDRAEDAYESGVAAADRIVNSL